MSYCIDAGIWSSVFAVPAAVVDEHIKMCSPLSLKILLVMLRHGGIPVDASWLSEQLNISPADISDALGYWVETGIVRRTDAPPVAAPARMAEPAAPAPSAAAAAVREEHAPTGQRIVTISARPKIAREDIVEMANADPSLSQLLREAQSILGAPLTPVESEILIALSTYYGMRCDVTLMLLQYCVSTGHKSMNYVEKTAASWLERGIDTHEKVEQEILRLMQHNENESKVVKAFGLHSRGLTPREREFVDSWFSLGLDEKLICLACERAAENTGKVSFAYADRIIQSWKQKGIVSVKAALDDLSAGNPAKQKQNKSAQTGDSSLDMDKIHRLLHGQTEG
ncbi:DnaD domain protein [Anaerotruncus rubiinfantis]|uniref:DnaD domain protein n=1 Tax=Anaerotruncus rubiinfantis TaxID=1720200 RepID=UPI001896CB2D|nr:DnaD domain protein [Anaerotruncus rubiinfantis]